MKLAFVDTETTGLYPELGHQPYEIGLILEDTEQTTGPFELCWWVKPDLALADPNSLAVGRFYERRPSTWPDSGEVAEVVAEYLHGAMLIGAVPSFDERILTPWLRAHGQAPTWHYQVRDAETLAVGWLRGRAAALRALAATDHPIEADVLDEVVKAAEGWDGKWDSNALSLAVGVDPDDYERHIALGDCRWVRAIYWKVMGQ